MRQEPAKRLALALLGNPALRRVSKPVEDTSAASVKNLVQALEKQVRASAGVGIAAPQLGENLRCFLVLDNPPEADDFDDESEMPSEEEIAKSFRYKPIFNPEIVGASEETAKDFEGCLSVPGYMAVVQRPTEIQVKYQNDKGDTEEETMVDFKARIFQHEMDHLEGVLYIDRMEHDSLIHTDEFQAMDPLSIQKLLSD